MLALSSARAADRPWGHGRRLAVRTVGSFLVDLSGRAEPKPGGPVYAVATARCLGAVLRCQHERGGRGLRPVNVDHTRCRRRPTVPRGAHQAVAASLTWLCLASVVGLWAQAPSSRDPAHLRPGIFLYAAPGIGDPRFAETVILLMEHGETGSAGVVLNQPSDVQLRKVLPDLAAARRLEVPVHWGGPVDPTAMVVLLRSPARSGSAKAVAPEIYRTTELEDLRGALEDARPDRQVRVYSGYAGWSPGQLESEVRQGAWLLDRADADAVFALDVSSLWEKVRSILKRIDVRARPRSVTEAAN